MKYNYRDSDGRIREAHLACDDYKWEEEGMELKAGAEKIVERHRVKVKVINERI